MTEAENRRGRLHGMSCPRASAASGRGTSTSTRRSPAAGTPSARGGRSSRPAAGDCARAKWRCSNWRVCVDGFWADVTRVKAAGKPTRASARRFAAVKAAQEAATAAIAPGVEARIPHEAATAVLVEAGFEKYVVHLTGHGLGFRYHEPEPFLMPGNTMKLKVGHVCSVEPGLYGSAFGGIRLEDNVAVTADGVERPDEDGKDDLTDGQFRSTPGRPQDRPISDAH